MAKNDTTKVEKGGLEPLDLSMARAGDKAGRAERIMANKGIKREDGNKGIEDKEETGGEAEVRRKKSGKGAAKEIPAALGPDAQILEDLKSQFAEAYRRLRIEGNKLSEQDREELFKKTTALSEQITGLSDKSAVDGMIYLIDREVLSVIPPIGKEEDVSGGKEEVRGGEEKENTTPAVSDDKEEIGDIERDFFNLYLDHFPEIEKNRGGLGGLPKGVAGKIISLGRQLERAGSNPAELKSLVKKIYSEPKERISRSTKEEIENEKQKLFEAEKRRLEEFRTQGGNRPESLRELEMARQKLFGALRKTRWETVPDFMIYSEIDNEISLFDEKMKSEKLQGDAAVDEALFGETRRRGRKNITNSSQRKPNGRVKFKARISPDEETDFLKKHPEGHNPGKNKSYSGVDFTSAEEEKYLIKRERGMGAEPPANLPIVGEAAPDVANATSETPAVNAGQQLDSGTQKQINESGESGADYSDDDSAIMLEGWRQYQREEAEKRAKLKSLSQDPEKASAPKNSESEETRGGDKEEARKFLGPFRGRHPRVQEQLPKEKISEMEFDKARTEYVRIYGEHAKKQTQRIGFLRSKIFGFKTKENEIPEDLMNAEKAYWEARKAYAKILYDEKRENLQKNTRPLDFDGTKDEYIDEELAKYRAELFGKFFLEEKIKLEDAKVETFPPRERGVFLKIWKKWAGTNKYLRLAITSALIGGGAAMAASGLAPAAILFGIGARVYRGARGLAGAGAGGFIAQKLMEKYYGGTLKEQREAGISEMGKSFNPENMDEAESGYEDFLRRLERRRNIETGVQVAAALAGGYFGTTGVNLIEKHWFSSGGGVTETVPVKPRIAEPPKAPSPEIVKEPEPITVKKGQGAWNPVHELLRRQLEENPEGFLKRINLKINPEELKNPAATEKILNRETLRLLNEQGYMKGGETLKGISRPGVGVSLDAENKIHIIGEGKTTYDFPKVKIAEVAGSEIEDLRAIHGHEAISNLPDIPVKDTEVPITAPMVPEGPAIIASELPSFPSASQKENYLNKIFGVNDGFFRDEKIPELAKVIKSGRLTVKDIDKYASAKQATPLSEKALENLKENFKIIADDDFSLPEKLQAMRSTKGSFQIMRLQMGLGANSLA